MEKEKYIAIIADIRNSRSIQNRDLVQNNLKNTLNKLNEYFENSIASKFTITLGDEFQGLLSDAKVTLDIITFIRLNMGNIDIRYGIGIGGVSTKIDKNLSIGSDGEVFYNARDAIEEVEKKEHTICTGQCDICIKYNTNQDVKHLNLLLDNISYIYHCMSDNQKEIVNSLLISKEYIKETICKERNISISSLNRTLRRVGFYNYKDTYYYINEKLEEIRTL